MTLCPAALHDPVTGNTRRVNVAWDKSFGGSLRIEDSEGNPLSIASGDLTLTSGGWSGNAVTFAWQSEGKTWAVTLDDPQALARLAQELPPQFLTLIAQWQGKSRRSTFWSSTALLIAAVLALLPLLVLLTLFIMRDRMIDIVISRLPPGIDAEIGEVVKQQIAASGKVVKEGPAIDAVRATGQRLVSHLPNRDFAFRFEVVNDKSVNAFAAPGGLVVVHTGLLARAASADQLAGVLSHEIHHVTRRHSLRQLLYSFGLTTTLSWSIGIPDGIAVTLAGAAADLSGLKFSREQETEADRGGVDLLQRARLPASGLQSFMDVLAAEKGSVPSFLSTHPADQERSEMLGRIIAEHGEWETEPLAIDWNAVQRNATELMNKK